MKELIPKADILINKARKMVSQQQGMENKLAALDKEIKELTEKLDTEKQKTEQLNNQIKIIKLARNIGSGQIFDDLNVTELKRKLNEYIREIDKCIELLND